LSGNPIPIAAEIIGAVPHGQLLGRQARANRLRCGALEFEKEMAMCCHYVHVTLSAEDKAAVKTMSGWMIPVYATVVLAVIALVAVSGGQRRGEIVASTAAPGAPAAAH
jgi:hypothetical protein